MKDGEVEGSGDKQYDVESSVAKQGKVASKYVLFDDVSGPSRVSRKDKKDGRKSKLSFNRKRKGRRY